MKIKNSITGFLAVSLLFFTGHIFAMDAQPPAAGVNDVGLLRHTQTHRNLANKYEGLKQTFDAICSNLQDEALDQQNHQALTDLLARVVARLDCGQISYSEIQQLEELKKQINPLIEGLRKSVESAQVDQVET